VCSTLGKGAFGDCFKAYDYKRQQYCAVKIIRNEPRFHRQGKVEVNVLEMLAAADPADQFSLVHMVDHMLFRGHLIITFELLGNDLYTELRLGNFAGMAQNVTQDIAGDILRCLELLGRMQVVHADLKPENILMRPDHNEEQAAAGARARAGPAHSPSPPANSRCKVIDFGSSCFAHGKVHTYIQSRYYRSPEIVLGLGYGPAIDMWSLGCILVELDSGVPLFSAKNEQDLMVLQLELLGVPADHVLARAKRASEFFSGRRPLRSSDRKGRPHPVGSRALTDACKTQDPLFIDFVSRCLTWDPAARMTAAEAMHHPWAVQAESPEPMCQPMETSSPKMRRVTDLISSDMLMLDQNDSGMSSADEQEVPSADSWVLPSLDDIGGSMSAMC
jgi:dual specificity tyrosine-phosphorylation-regulated kinase 2/3/4